MNENGKRTIKLPRGQKHPFKESSPGVVTFDSLDSFAVGEGRYGHEKFLYILMKLAEGNDQYYDLQCELTVEQARDIAHELLKVSDRISPPD